MREIVISSQNKDRFHAEIFHFVTEANGAQDRFLFRRQLLSPEQRQAFEGSPLDAVALCQRALTCREELAIDGDGILVVIVEGNVQDAEDDEYFIVSSQGQIGQPGAVIVSTFYLEGGSTFMREGDAWWNEQTESTRRRIASDSILLNLLCAASEALDFACHTDCVGCVMDYCQTPIDIIAALRGGFTFCSHCTQELRKTADGLALLAIAERLTKHPYRARPLPGGGFDVFMCHHTPDKPSVREVCDRLRARGIQPWLDVEQLRPGYPWQRTLEEQISKIQSAAVCVGSAGPGPWQTLELEAFLREFVRRRCPVIPVILATAPQVPELPVFLQGMTWVDFRRPEPDPLGQLIWGITGERPVT